MYVAVKKWRLRLGNWCATRDTVGMVTDDMSQTPTKKRQAPLKLKRVSGRVQSGQSSDIAARPLKEVLRSGLYLVATPIGNLGDFSLRGQKTLESADLILAEDTRVARKLLGLFGLTGRIERCDEAATAIGITRACEVLAQGGVVAFCADAGTPGVSDPGERLARGVIEAGYGVQAIPGASAALTALTISGLPSAQFMFAGFAPAKAGARLSFLKELAHIKATLIFYETGPRLAASLQAMSEAFGDRPVCVARELTKMYEEVRRGTLSELVKHYSDIGAPKGEIVVVVGGAPEQINQIMASDLDDMIAAALREGRLKDVATQIAAATGLPRRDIYARGLVLNKAKPL